MNSAVPTVPAPAGYWEVTELSGGTFTAGAGTDWGTQFTDSGVNKHGVASLAGELYLAAGAVDQHLDTTAVHASNVSLTAQGADVADTGFSGVTAPGLYRVSVYLEDTTADATAGAVTANIKFTDEAGSQTLSVGPLALTTKGSAQAVFFVRVLSGSITYGVSHTGLYGTAKYAFFAAIEAI